MKKNKDIPVAILRFINVRLVNAWLIHLFVIGSILPLTGSKITCSNRGTKKYYWITGILLTVCGLSWYQQKKKKEKQPEGEKNKAQ